MILPKREVLLAVAAAILTGAATQAPPAREPNDIQYHLLGFSLGGTKSVDTDALVAALPEHEGEVVTASQIKKDADRIRAELAARHVHGDMTQAFFEREGPGHHIWVVWDVHQVDALSYVPKRRKWHFASQTFSGNAKLTDDQLAAATRLHPGDAMKEGMISEARTGIEQSYDKALHAAPVTVNGRVKLKKDDSVTIDWQIGEPK